jgi:cell division protein FtsL
VKKQHAKTAKAVPVIRFRFMAVVVTVLVLLVFGPLLLVWKQAYITGSSMKIEAMNDTLSAMNKKIAALRLAGERLSSNERIESFGRDVLKLDYPSSDQIVIVPACSKKEKKVAAAGMGRLFAGLPDAAGEGRPQ